MDKTAISLLSGLFLEYVWLLVLMTLFDIRRQNLSSRFLFRCTHNWYCYLDNALQSLIDRPLMPLSPLFPVLVSTIVNNSGRFPFFDG